MKIRSGFVSNSSSSSFVLIGIQYDSSFWEEALKKAGIREEEDGDRLMSKEGLILKNGTEENGIKKGKMVVATDFISADECGYMNSSFICFDEAEEKLLSKGFDGKIATIVGTMLT